VGEYCYRLIVILVYNTYSFPTSKIFYKKNEILLSIILYTYHTVLIINYGVLLTSFDIEFLNEHSADVLIIAVIVEITITIHNYQSIKEQRILYFVNSSSVKILIRT
jgi:hypothetical protein